ncbi:hypothetical protein RFI_39661, partial [Reticulomyxa filosa]
ELIGSSEIVTSSSVIPPHALKVEPPASAMMMMEEKEEEEEEENDLHRHKIGTERNNKLNISRAEGDKKQYMEVSSSGGGGSGGGGGTHESMSGSPNVLSTKRSSHRITRRTLEKINIGGTNVMPLLEGANINPFDLYATIRICKESSEDNKSQNELELFGASSAPHSSHTGGSQKAMSPELETSYSYSKDPLDAAPWQCKTHGAQVGGAPSVFTISDTASDKDEPISIYSQQSLKSRRPTIVKRTINHNSHHTTNDISLLKTK